MNNVAKKLAVALLLSVPCMQAVQTTGQSFYMGHSQTGTMNDVLGWNNQINLFGNDEFSFVFKGQTEGGMSFSNSKLAPYFTSNGTKQMVFGPAHNATTYASTDVSGINFLLSDTFQSTVVFNPEITNWVTDFAAYLDLANWCEGLHLRGHLPLQYLKHNLELTETVAAAGGATYTNHYVSNGTPAVAYTSVAQAFQGDKLGGDALQVWNYGTINGSHHGTKVTDITASIGYNFVNNENGHFGLEVGGLFGAGGKSKAKHVFEPIFGTAGRMGIFGAVDGHAVLWTGENDEKQLQFFGNGKVGYVFANHQLRSYDYLNFGTWSRYLLVKKITTVSTTGNSVYGGIDNSINITTLHAKIGDYVNFDVSALFDMQYNNFNFQLGYNLGGQSAEKHKGFTDTITANTYIVYAPTLAADYITAAVGGNNAVSATGVTNVEGNFSINGDITTTVPAVLELTTANEATIAITNSWLDTNSALAKTIIAHSVVGAVNYTWRDNEYVPCVGIYGKAEFDGKDHNTADLWAVGLQGNVSF